MGKKMKQQSADKFKIYHHIIIQHMFFQSHPHINHPANNWGNIELEIAFSVGASSPLVRHIKNKYVSHFSLKNKNRDLKICVKNFKTGRFCKIKKLGR